MCVIVHVDAGSCILAQVRGEYESILAMRDAQRIRDRQCPFGRVLPPGEGKYIGTALALTVYVYAADLVDKRIRHAPDQVGILREQNDPLTVFGSRLSSALGTVLPAPSWSEAICLTPELGPRSGTVASE
jgi:hypothetical protein